MDVLRWGLYRVNILLGLRQVAMVDCMPIAIELYLRILVVTYSTRNVGETVEPQTGCRTGSDSTIFTFKTYS